MVPLTFLSVTVSHRHLTVIGRRGPPDMVVCLRGEHDLSTMAELSVTMARAMALGDGDLVLDLSRVEFMGASTVGVIVQSRDVLRARSRSLVVRSPSRCARRVLELCDLSDLIHDRLPETLVPETLVPEALVPETLVPEALVPEAPVRGRVDARAS